MSSGRKHYSDGPVRVSRNIWVAVIACAFVSVGTIIFWSRTKEPVYQGKPLHAWLEQSTAGGPMAAADTNRVEAIRQIGTNAVPTLLKMAQVTDSRLTSACIKVLRAQSVIHFHVHTDEEYHEMACVGFYALGPLGKAAVPDLIALLNRTKEQIHGVAADCLGSYRTRGGGGGSLLDSIHQRPKQDCAVGHNVKPLKNPFAS
jgi:hypothetical protein